MIFLYYNSYCKCIDRFNIGAATPSRVATMHKREKNNNKTRNAFRFAETFLKNVKYDINYNYETSLNSITFYLTEEYKIRLGERTDKITIPIFNSISYIPYKIREGEIINIYFYILYWNKDLHSSSIDINDNHMDYMQDIIDDGFIDSHTSLLNSIKLRALEDSVEPGRLDRLEFMDDLIHSIITNTTLYNQDEEEILTDLHEQDEINDEDEEFIRWMLMTHRSSSFDINKETLVSGAGGDPMYTRDYKIKDYETLFYIPKQALYNGYDREQVHPHRMMAAAERPPEGAVPMMHSPEELINSMNLKFSDFTFIKKKFLIEPDPNTGEEYLLEVKEDILVVNLDEVIEKQIELYEIYNHPYETIINCRLSKYLCEQHKCNWVTESNICLTDSYCNNDSDCTDTEVCEFVDGKCQFIN